jgi:hypothetical protein
MVGWLVQYNIYMIKFVSDLWQVSGFLPGILPIKLTAKI